MYVTRYELAAFFALFHPKILNRPYNLSTKYSSFPLLSGPPLQVKKKPTQQWVGLFFSVPSMFNSLRVQIPYKGLENRSIRETQGHCREAMSERSVYQSCDLTNRNRI